MSRTITINGETANVSQWAKRLNVTRGAISYRKKTFGESSEDAIRHFLYKNIANERAEDIIRTLKFYNDKYVKPSMKSLGCALPNLIGNVDGAGRILSRAIADLEEVARITDIRIKELEKESEAKNGK